jgi:hypothetical protein
LVGPMIGGNFIRSMQRELHWRKLTTIIQWEE